MSYLALVDSDTIDNALIQIDACRAILTGLSAPMLNDVDRPVDISARTLGTALAGIEMLLGHARSGIALR